MARYIVKLSEGDQSWYLEWSSVVDAPVTFGCSLEEFRQYYQDYYGIYAMDEFEKRMARVEEKGISSFIHDSVEDIFNYNRAGKNETCLSKQQMIDFYCKVPKFSSIEEYKEYEQKVPMGKKIGM